jgi:hypothetical protein
MIGPSKLLVSVLSPLVFLLQPTYDHSLVRISETNLDISPHGVTVSTCVLVQPDGRLHFETRIQQLPAETATLHIYEATLDSFHMLRLNNLLDAPGVRYAETFPMPQLPLTTPTVNAAIVEIPRERSIQKLGYLAWNERSGKQNERPESEPAAVKERWQQSRVLLTPLLQWFHELQFVKMSELPQSASTLCRDDSIPE